MKPHLKKGEKLSVRNLFSCTWPPRRSVGFTAASGVFCKPIGFGSLGACIEPRMILPLETRMPAEAVPLSLFLEVYCDLFAF